MSGDLPIRKARTKREKNKSYNDSRNKFRASMKPERTDNATSEEDDKIKEKKMKVDGQAEGAQSTTYNVSEDKAKQAIKNDDVDEKVIKKLTEETVKTTSTKEEEDNNRSGLNRQDKETGEVKNSDDFTKGETSKTVSEHHEEAQGSSKSLATEEKKVIPDIETVKVHLMPDEIYPWEYMFDSDEDEKEVHSKGPTRYFKCNVATPPAKSTSEEENTDDEEKDEDSDATIKISSESNNGDKDDEGNGGGASGFGGEKEGDGSADAGEGATGGKNENNTMDAGDIAGGAGGNVADGNEGQNINTEDDEEPPDDNNKSDEQLVDEEMEEGDFSTGELNLEGAVDPYDFTDDEEDEIGSDYYDRYEFLSQDGGSDHGSDISFPGDFPDEEHYGENAGEFHEEGTTFEGRGAG